LSLGERTGDTSGGRVWPGNHLSALRARDGDTGAPLRVDWSEVVGKSTAEKTTTT